MSTGYWVVALIIVMSVGGGILRRSAANWGAQKGKEYAAGNSASAAVELGTALWFPAATAAYPVVQAILVKPMMVTEVNPNLWQKADTADDSLQISWEPNGAGAYLLIRRAKAHVTRLGGARWWDKTMAQIEKQAAAQGIQVQRVPGQLQHTGSDGEHAVYTR